MPIVKTEKVNNLEGQKRNRITRVGDGSIICLFDKTPHPQKSTDVVCPHFLNLKWANGCYFNCSWCYLQGTFRFHPEWKIKPNIKNMEKIKEHMQLFIQSKTDYPEILNAGELSDSLLTETTVTPFSSLLEEVFRQNNTTHKVLFLTKSDKIENILRANLQKHLIMSFSLNAGPVAKRWEKGAPNIRRRIEAAEKVSKAGYITRIRIDPMVPVNEWEIHYKNLIDNVFSNFTPDRITIGSLRGLQSTINAAKDKSWVSFLNEKSNWGRKISLQSRCEMYSTIINYLEEEYEFTDIALCKETVEAWDLLNLDYKRIKCNCVG